jgi:hypothetical protein
MRTQSADRFVIARESNVVRVDFNREPDPPAPRFPGAGALRDDEGDMQPAVVAVAASH